MAQTAECLGHAGRVDRLACREEKIAPNDRLVRGYVNSGEPSDDSRESRGRRGDDSDRVDFASGELREPGAGNQSIARLPRGLAVADRAHDEKGKKEAAIAQGLSPGVENK